MTVFFLCYDRHMESLLDTLTDADAWKEFLDFRLSRLHPGRDAERLSAFVKEERWRASEGRLKGCEGPEWIPARKYVNKGNSGARRVVYTFAENEAFLLKHLGYRLNRYDSILSDACVSFRPGRSVKRAFRSLLRIPDLERRYVLKADIHDYFNSVPVRRLLEELKPVMADDPRLYDFLYGLLSRDEAMENGRPIYGERGILAGTAVSVFLANFWLTPVDEYFVSLGVPYMRYSDDIILFADSEKQRDELERALLERIEERGLTVNPDKYARTSPGEPWEYLGFCYERGKIRLSDHTVKKLKAKIRRKARALYRWRIRKNVPFESAARRMIKVFSRKLFEGDAEERLCWTAWYFPLLTCDEGLQEIDRYFVRYIRYLKTGRHGNAGYGVTYDEIRALGFRSLRHEYYRWKEKAYETADSNS